MSSRHQLSVIQPASVPGRSSLQRALLSVSSARKRSGAERLAAPFLGSLEQLERPSPAGPPLQRSELAALRTPEASLERLVPLVDYSAAWKLLTNVSRWVMHTVEQGYRGALPPPFNGVTPMLVGPEQALVMEQEVSTLLRKEAIEVVPPLDKESGFYSCTSLFLERGSVLFRSKLTEPLSHTTEVQKALLKPVSHTRSEDWWSWPI